MGWIVKPFPMGVLDSKTLSNGLDTKTLSNGLDSKTLSNGLDSKTLSYGQPAFRSSAPCAHERAHVYTCGARAHEYTSRHLSGMSSAEQAFIHAVCIDLNCTGRSAALRRQRHFASRFGPQFFAPASLGAQFGGQEVLKMSRRLSQS